MIKAIGLVEFNSIAKGIEISDKMLKTANVEIVMSAPTCPGKYITLLNGDVSAVESSIKSARSIGGMSIVDDLIISNVDERIFPAIMGVSDVKEIQSIGVIESFSTASLIIAADASVKAAGVELIEMRLGSGTGGKAYVLMTGDVSAVEEAVEAGVSIIKESGNVVGYSVISSPHRGLKEELM